VLARQHARELHLADRLFDGERSLIGLFQRRFVAGLDREIEQYLGVVERCTLLLPAVGGIAPLGLLLQQRLGSLLVVPEVGRAGDLVDLRYTLPGAVDVKDAPGGRRASPRGLRSGL
jgi:hypothetical protein